MSQKKPAGHVRHAAATATATNVPAAHDAQVGAPALEKVPTPQLKQLVPPELAAYFPAMQLMQVADRIADVAPGAQGLGAAVPAGQ